MDYNLSNTLCSLVLEILPKLKQYDLHVYFIFWNLPPIVVHKPAVVLQIYGICSTFPTSVLIQTLSSYFFHFNNFYTILLLIFIRLMGVKQKKQAVIQVDLRCIVFSNYMSLHYRKPNILLINKTKILMIKME